jgi:hypothetical protein
VGGGAGDARRCAAVAISVGARVAVGLVTRVDGTMGIAVAVGAGIDGRHCGGELATSTVTVSDAVAVGGVQCFAVAVALASASRTDRACQHSSMQDCRCWCTRPARRSRRRCRRGRRRCTACDPLGMRHRGMRDCSHCTSRPDHTHQLLHGTRRPYCRPGACSCRWRCRDRRYRSLRRVGTGLPLPRTGRWTSNSRRPRCCRRRIMRFAGLHDPVSAGWTDQEVGGELIRVVVSVGHASDEPKAMRRVTRRSDWGRARHSSVS